MTSTLPTQTRGALPDGRGRLPTPPRDRRPALAGLALLLIVVGALASALVVYRSGDRVEVLVAARDIEAGQIVTSADFTTARVASDGDAALVPASALSRFVNSTATVRVPSGSLVNRLMFRSGGSIPDGASVVGLVLSPQQRPTEPLRSGDIVRAFLVANGDAAVTGDPIGTKLVDAARVVQAKSGGAGADSLSVSLLVRDGDTAKLVTAASQGQVALVKLPGGSSLPVDAPKSGS